MNPGGSIGSGFISSFRIASIIPNIIIDSLQAITYKCWCQTNLKFYSSPFKVFRHKKVSKVT